MFSIVLFFVLNLINVVLGTMRSILTVKATPTVAMLINTVSYTFYAGIVKMVSGQSMWVVLTATAVTNIIGVYIAKWIVAKMTKDKLWLVKLTVPYGYSGLVEQNLKNANIPYNYVDVGKYTTFECYCEKQADTTKVLDIAKECDGKVFATENKL